MKWDLHVVYLVESVEPIRDSIPRLVDPAYLAIVDVLKYHIECSDIATLIGGIRRYVRPVEAGPSFSHSIGEPRIIAKDGFSYHGKWFIDGECLEDSVVNIFTRLVVTLLYLQYLIGAFFSGIAGNGRSLGQQ